MKPSGLSKLCIFSISGNREVQSKQHPFWKFSHVPTMSEQESLTLITGS